MERNNQEQRRYGEEESASIKSETKKFNGMRLEEADKKLRSVLYLALVKRRKKDLRTKIYQGENLTNLF